MAPETGAAKREVGRGVRLANIDWNIREFVIGITVVVGSIIIGQMMAAMFLI